MGTRFPALSTVYNKELKKLAQQTAKELGFESFVRKGVYTAQVGPAFETPAECRYLKSVSIRQRACGFQTLFNYVTCIYICIV